MVDPVQRYYIALGGKIPLVHHGVGSVVITSKNVFVYTCACGHVENDITTMMEHTAPEASLQLMDTANWIYSKVKSWEDWMGTILEDKYFLPPFINWLHLDRPRIARK